MHHGQVLLRMGAKGKSPTLAKRVRSLINFRAGHELFMFDPNEEESLQKIRDQWEAQKLKDLTAYSFRHRYVFCGHNRPKADGKL